MGPSSKVRYTVFSFCGIQGKVYIQFVIERDGSITDVKVLRGVDASLDKEAALSDGEKTERSG